MLHMRPVIRHEKVTLGSLLGSWYTLVVSLNPKPSFLFSFCGNVTYMLYCLNKRIIHPWKKGYCYPWSVAFIINLEILHFDLQTM